MADILLKVKDLQVGYGGIQAVKGVSLEVREGELVSLIGSNGAGKTTTMKAITGTLPLQAGDIEYLGKSIQGQGPWDLVKQGLAMVPEGRGVFTRMTITENLQMGAYIRSDSAGIADDIEKMFTIFPRLRERKDQLAGTMARPSFTRSQAPWPRMLRPRYSMSPPASANVPVIAFMVVVLPAPLEPIRVTSSPSRTSKSTPLTAWIPP
jgi:ABC-type sugar transport system ATPase subunit